MKYLFLTAIGVILFAGGWISRDFYQEKIIIYNPADIYEFENALNELSRLMSLYNSFAVQAFPIVWNSSKQKQRIKLKRFAYTVFDSSFVNELKTNKKIKVR